MKNSARQFTTETTPGSFEVQSGILARHSGRAGSNLRSIVLAALVTGSFATPLANAQNYAINWFKIAGGGGTSTNGQFTLSGTIGQHEAGGPMIGGNYSLTGGFLGLSP